MNMKKSIAGVMAGAMAVSAMATVVSADQDAISLNYDLKTYVNNVNKDSAKVTVVANYEGSLVTKESVDAGYITFGADNVYVRSGDVYNKGGVKLGTVNSKGSWTSVDAANSDLVEFEFTARPYKDIVNDVEEKYQTFKATSEASNVDGAYYDKNMGGSTYNMQICTEGNDTIGKFDLRKYDVLNLGYSTSETVKAAGLEKLLGYDEVEVVTPGTPATKTGDFYYMLGSNGEKVEVNKTNLPWDDELVFEKDKDFVNLSTETFTVWGTVCVIDGKYYWENGKTIVYNGIENVEVQRYLEFTADELKAFNAADYNFEADKATMYLNGAKVTVYREDVVTPGTDDVTETVQVAKVPTAGTYAVRDAVAKLTYKVPNTVKLIKASGWGWDAGLNESEINDVAKKYLYADLTSDVTMTAEVFAGGFFDANGNKKGMIKPDTALASTPTTVAVGAFTAGAAGETKIPFRTTLKPSSWTHTSYDSEGNEVKTYIPDNDVIAALENRKEGGKYYTRPLAVINDAIANHDNVTFTFKSYDGYVATEKSVLMNQWVCLHAGYDYETSGKGYDWHNPTFGQHLYTNVPDGYALMDVDVTEYDQYGSYSSAWMTNLFTGAVVVNKDLTMQLSDTDAFEWGTNTLTFDWFDITDEGKITDAKTFLNSMLLYTPVDWYWDTLSVVVSDDEDEAIDAGEGLDGEGDVIDDEEPADVEEEPEVEEEPVVEEPEVVETEAAPVETAPSPATGNAPVALAVIPVALAAAAVVAKKRG